MVAYFFIVFLMSRYCKCPVALPHGAVGGMQFGLNNIYFITQYICIHEVTI